MKCYQLHVQRIYAICINMLLLTISFICYARDKDKRSVEPLKYQMYVMCNPGDFRLFISVNRNWMWNSSHSYVPISNKNIHISSPRASKQHKVQ